MCKWFSDYQSVLSQKTEALWVLTPTTSCLTTDRKEKQQNYSVYLVNYKQVLGTESDCQFSHKMIKCR